MDNSFATLFDTFYLKLTILNYKLKTNTVLNEEYNKIKHCMSYMIPIFNRILGEKNLTVENIMNNDKPVENTNEYPFVNDDTVTNETKKNDNQINLPYKKEDEKEKEDEEEKDEEGDTQVKAITEKSLEILKYIQENKWVVAQYYENESSDEDDIQQNEENEENEDNKNVSSVNLDEKKNIPTIKDAHCDESFESMEFNEEADNEKDNINHPKSINYSEEIPTIMYI